MGYSEQFKTRIVSKLVGPDALSANALSGEVGISQATLSRWLRCWCSKKSTGDLGGRGRRHVTDERLTIIGLFDTAVKTGARLSKACALLGLSVRTVQRWRAQGSQGFDARFGPKTSPGNKLSVAERRQVLAGANEPAHRDLSPKQLVPKLADEGRYLASESTFYRILHEEQLLHHRQPSRPPTANHCASGPCEVLSWDITHLRSPIRGVFYYLRLIDATAAQLGRNPAGMVLHSDNGSPMKGSTMLATLQRLGIAPSFSRPRVSDDNPYSESLFRTLKYRPAYPQRPFNDLDAARAWVTDFVTWYNTEDLQSGIGFVTPHDRHEGNDIDIPTARRPTYEAARKRHPERWSGETRAWGREEDVTLNPARDKAAA